MNTVNIVHGFHTIHFEISIINFNQSVVEF